MLRSGCVPSMHVRILGPGLVCAGVPCVVSSGVVGDEDDACMDASNLVTHGFSEYHDDSCTRLNALLDSRVGRGHDGRGAQSC